MLHRIRLVMSGPSRGEIFMDGKKVEGVRSIDVRASVDEINAVTLSLNCEAVEVEGDFCSEGLVEITSIGDTSRRFRRMTLLERVKRWALRRAWWRMRLWWSARKFPPFDGETHDPAAH